jgi:hypothetical protein
VAIAASLLQHTEAILEVGHRYREAHLLEGLVAHLEATVDHPEVLVVHQAVMVDRLEVLEAHLVVLVDHPEVMVAHQAVMVDRLEVLAAYLVAMVDHPEVLVAHPEVLVAHLLLVVLRVHLEAPALRVSRFSLHYLEISAIFHPLERLDSIDTVANRPQNDVLSLDGAHIGEPISSRQSENGS